MIDADAMNEIELKRFVSVPAYVCAVLKMDRALRRDGRQVCEGMTIIGEPSLSYLDTLRCIERRPLRMRR
jgi:hypothetical protein